MSDQVISDQINVEVQERVLTVRINRPEKKNALTQAMYAAMIAAIRQAEAEASVRVIFITGTSDCFTAGNDLADFANAKPGMARAHLRQADATALPFDADCFDAVVCQFGVMFFPDRVAGYREARRVLRAGGRACFSIWDSLAHNAIPRCVNDAMARHFPVDPPRFLARTPHGHHDQATIRRELAQAGFERVAIETVTLPSRAASHRDPAIGFCQGSPMRAEIEARAPQGLSAATAAAAAAVAAEFGSGPIEAPMKALIVVAEK